MVVAGAIALIAAGAAACSPEAHRTRDGGPGADPGNKALVQWRQPRDPEAADTTLWPGRNPTPSERLAEGRMPPPAGDTPPAASAAERTTFDSGARANPRRSSSQPDRRP